MPSVITGCSVTDYSNKQDLIDTTNFSLVQNGKVILQQSGLWKKYLHPAMANAAKASSNKLATMTLDVRQHTNSQRGSAVPNTRHHSLVALDNIGADTAMVAATISTVATAGRRQQPTEAITPSQSLQASKKQQT